MTDSYLIANRIETPDGTILQSFYRHDYKTHLDANGELYMVDGGLHYQRRSVNNIPFKELSVYTEDNFLVQRDAFSWGTRGKDGKQQLKYRLLKDLDTDHIEAILETQHHIPNWTHHLLEKELEYRNVKEPS